MKKIILILAMAAAVTACKNEKAEGERLSENREIAQEYQFFGDKITDKDVLNRDQMTEKFHSLKVGDTLDLKFASEVKEVCQKKGCWMKLDLDNEVAMVRFKDYGFFMPKDIEGQEVIVAGKAYIEEMSVEDQKHYAEDGGKTAEEVAAITEPKITYTFEANGVLIPEIEKQ